MDKEKDDNKPTEGIVIPELCRSERLSTSTEKMLQFRGEEADKGQQKL